MESDIVEIIENKKIDAYIENFKEDKFYGGIIEIGKFEKLYDKNIKYKEDKLSLYKHYINII